MYPPHIRRQAAALLQSGLTYAEVSRRLVINRSTLREWARNPELVEKYADHAQCARCAPVPGPPEPQAAFSHLLGLYLGDGCISPVGEPSKKVLSMRITLDDSWPGIIRECTRTLQAVLPGHSIGAVQQTGCTEVIARWKHWGCYFPQHGPGKKHRRAIVLAEWQAPILDRHPEPFLRGLFHSDGCRVTNRVRRRAGDGWRHYAYPRYFLTNTSGDILVLAQNALDRIGVRWSFRWASPAKPHHRRPGHLSVAEKRSVAVLDSFIGPKY